MEWIGWSLSLYSIHISRNYTRKIQCVKTWWTKRTKERAAVYLDTFCKSFLCVIYKMNLCFKHLPSRRLPFSLFQGSQFSRSSSNSRHIFTLLPSFNSHNPFLAGHHVCYVVAPRPPHWVRGRRETKKRERENTQADSDIIPVSHRRRTSIFQKSVTSLLFLINRFAQEADRQTQTDSK